jgi:2,5-furandicarboxylate decarboxylase 1
MSFHSLQAYLGYLRKKCELVTIDTELSPSHEIAVMLSYLDKHDSRAVYFSRPNGYQTPIVGNLFGSRERMEEILNLGEDPAEGYATKLKAAVAPRLTDQGPVQEVDCGKQSLLEVLPALTHHAGDVGPYLTTAVMVAKNPSRGHRSMGLHRVQIQGPREVGIFLATPPLSTFFREAEAMSRPLEFALVIGPSPAVFLASIAQVPEGRDKLELAGAFLESPVELVRGKHVNLEYPAEAQFVLEGELFPNRRRKEGPFGESSGYYLTYDNPTGIVKAIYRRTSPVYHALQTFTRENTILLSVLWEASELASLRESIPGLRRGRLFGVMGEHAVLQVDEAGAARAKENIRAILETYPYIKGVILVDQDVDVNDDQEIYWALGTRFQPDRDLVILSGLAGGSIDPSAENGTVTSKWGCDCTKHGKEERFQKIGIKPEAWQRVASVAGVVSARGAAGEG